MLFPSFCYKICHLATQRRIHGEEEFQFIYFYFFFLQVETLQRSLKSGGKASMMSNSPKAVQSRMEQVRELEKEASCNRNTKKKKATHTD